MLFLMDKPNELKRKGEKIERTDWYKYEAEKEDRL